MKQAYRLTALALSVLLLLSSCSAATADGDGRKDAGAVQNGVEAGGTGAEPEETFEDPAAFVPEEVRYDGLTVRVLTSSPFHSSTTNEIAPLEDEYMPGEIVPESVVERNNLLFEKLGVNLEAVQAQKDQNNSGISVQEELSRSIAAGAKEFDALCCTVENAYKCAVQQLLFNLAAVDTLDLSHPWWCQKSVKAFDYGADTSIIYYMNGDINYFDNWGTECFYANKDFLSISGYEMPYDLVREHKWTFDAFRSMAAGMYRDLDGNGVKSFGDAYALVGTTAIMERFLPAMDLPLLYKDEEGTYVINMTDVFVNTAEKMYDMFLGDLCVWLDGGEYDAIFRDGNAAFSEDYLYFLRTASGFMEADYGVLPYPLRDESQEKYSCTVNESYASVYGIPLYADPETVGLIMDVMGAYSVNTVTKAVIDNGAMIRNARDEDTAEMVAVILDTTEFSFSSIVNWGNLNYLFNNLLHDGKNLDYASAVAKVRKFVDKMQEKDMAALRDPKG